jgi:hypothetical protein
MLRELSAYKEKKTLVSMRMRIRIQFRNRGSRVFMTKLIKFYSWKKIQATREAFSPQKRTSDTIKHDIQIP